MRYEFLYETLPFLKTLNQETQDQFVEYFKAAPRWLLEAFRIEKIKKGTVFIREGEPANMVFFVGGSTVEATDYRIYGMTYNYRKYNRVYAFGAMEILMDLREYMTTMRVISDCTMVMIPRVKYEKWLFTDINALRYETKRMGEDLHQEARNNRLFLFLQGSDRLALLFVRRYEQYAKKNGTLTVKGSRQNMADETGLCIKSVSRGIKRFSDGGLITKDGNRISISESQYEGLKKLISSQIYLE